jgi:hypothetical protein
MTLKTIKTEFLAKRKKAKYQVIDETGRVLCSCKSESTAINMKKEFQLNKYDKLEIRKVME